MREPYVIAFGITIAILIFTIVESFQSKKEIAASLRNVLFAAVIAISGNLLALISGDKTVCMAAYSVFFIGIDWLLFYLLNFVAEYTTCRIYPASIRHFVGIVMMLDSFSMFLNMFFHHAFVCRKVTVPSGEYFYRITAYLPYDIHLAISYIVIVAIFICLIAKICYAPTVYRGKYISVAAVLLAVVAGDAVYVFLGGIIDVSILGYAIGGLLIYYMSVIYIPGNVKDRILSMVVQDMTDGVVLFDMDGNCIHANESACMLVPQEERMEPEKFFEQKYAQGEKTAKSRQLQEYTTEIDGVELHLQVGCKTLLDKKNVPLGNFFNIQNRTEEINNLRRERYLATHDRLTGLYNKEYFYVQVEKLLRENPTEDYLMICSDIRNFKLVNDVFGTESGDRILYKIGQAMQKHTIPGEVYGRLDNDRFGLCMREKDYKEQTFIQEPAKVVQVDRDITYPVKVYLGVYRIEERAIPVSVMCDRALMAVNSIKGSYQTQIAYYDEVLRNNVLKEQEIMSEFKEALKKEQMELYLQPQICYDGKTRGAEVLARWNHPKKGVLAPAYFIDIFEKNGTIVKLDEYMWEHACRKLWEWKLRGREDMYLSVNISPKDFYFTDVYEVIVGLVQKYDIRPQNLHLEITETSVTIDAEERLSLIKRLQEKGFILEMDDFGSGYSSLNMLKDVSVDVLKVDMEFLNETTDMERSRKILGYVIGLAKDLGMETIVEGVETAEQVEFLRRMHCDKLQGYYFAKPMRVEEFERIYMEGEKED